MGARARPGAVRTGRARTPGCAVAGDRDPLPRPGLWSPPDLLSGRWPPALTISARAGGASSSSLVSKPPSGGGARRRRPASAGPTPLRRSSSQRAWRRRTRRAARSGRASGRRGPGSCRRCRTRGTSGRPRRPTKIERDPREERGAERGAPRVVARAVEQVVARAVAQQPRARANGHSASIANTTPREQRPAQERVGHERVADDADSSGGMSRSAADQPAEVPVGLRAVGRAVELVRAPLPDRVDLHEPAEQRRAPRRPRASRPSERSA